MQGGGSEQELVIDWTITGNGKAISTISRQQRPVHARHVIPIPFVRVTKLERAWV